MKRFSLAVLSLLTFAASFAYADHRPEVVTVVPRQVFAPMGFDDNDNVQVVLEGIFPNTCYKTGPVKKSIQYSESQQRGIITIHDEAYLYRSVSCMDMIVPYSKVVDLGLLPEGVFEIRVVANGVSKESVFMKSIPIAAAKTSAPDDFLYAPVREISVYRHPESHRYNVTLRGTFNNSCMELKQILTRMGNNIIEILPITERGAGQCLPMTKPFESTLELKTYQPGISLFHVRSMSGQSLNQVVHLDFH